MSFHTWCGCSPSSCFLLVPLAIGTTGIVGGPPDASSERSTGQSAPPPHPPPPPTKSPPSTGADARWRCGPGRLATMPWPVAAVGAVAVTPAAVVVVVAAMSCVPRGRRTAGCHGQGSGVFEILLAQHFTVFEAIAWNEGGGNGGGDTNRPCMLRAASYTRPKFEARIRA